MALSCATVAGLGLAPTGAGAASAKQGAAGRAVALSGGPVKAAVICGAKRRVVSLPKNGRAFARVRGTSRRTLVLSIARCSPSRRWVSWEKTRVRTRGGPVRVRLPLLVPGRYRVRAPGVRPAYLRIAGRGSGLRDPETGKLYPLLDRDRVRAPMMKFCDGPNGKGPKRPDGARLPLDPRRLVNANLRRDDIAAYYNASWIEVHDAPGFRPHPIQFPKTCGGFREWAADGRRFIETRPFFALLGGLRAYDNLWRVWGLTQKPVDFDQQVMDRYGLSKAPFRNPYPRPGEDPNATGGGSGQLPLGLIQGRNRDGSYNGKVTITCSACHDSILGDSSDGIGLHYGRGSDAFDPTMFGVELAAAAMIIGDSPEYDAAPAGVLPYPYSTGRGVTNSFGLLDFLPALFDMETLDTQPGVEFFPSHGAAGQVQTPNWWNRSHRTRMFLNGELSGDNSRVGMALAIADPKKTGADRKALEPDFERIHVFFDSLSPPRYPGKVDKALAEEGAILFHTKDLWDDPRNKGIPQVGGNGSCASCHGVYSPRFAHDERYLPDPRLKGVSASITPLETIRTDKARTNLVNEQFKRAWNTSWWGYDELNPKWTKEGQGRRGTTFERMLSDYGFGADRLSGPNVWTNDPLGYEAPPLYGIWASAPYFHNASVPTVRGVLRPGERPKVWRRPSGPAGSGGIVQGYDRSLKGYDMQNLGYRFDSLPCPDPCHPKASPISVVEGMISNILGDDLWLANQAPTPMGENDRQRRMIVNTTEYSRGNQGHEFTQALTDDEVKAILEYLKTL